MLAGENMKKNDQLFVQEELLFWYDREYIMLPWRKDKDPYKIWISEIMLQQTRVEAVIPYFEKFIGRLPTVNDLANVDEDELMKLWQGLGYYRRAKNLRIAANQIVDEFDSLMPKSVKKLKMLKGIGEYTSGAIASIAFDEVAPAVDGNILRIFARLFGVKDDIRKASVRKQLSLLYTPFIPKERPGDFNQALMDLGRKICISSKNPLCEDCPLASKCFTYKNDLQSEIPFLSKKKARKKEQKTIVLILNNQKVWIKKRPENGLLSSLYEYLTLDGHLKEEDIKSLVESSTNLIKELPKSTHIFSHIEWDMIAYLVETDVESVDDKGKFVAIDSLHTTYSIPTAFKTYTNWLLNKKR